ncbi:nuclear receptor corepressor 1 [Stylonychia lemnae]|uniref:Nuclear receptor corepressor 1 n=1 Tax=Stylonychia lemnae TaxID=5949 RepID=A0A077ZWI5_STYLE|nr:nuclear receptor corepressor 1 [Stylonychia lemnae]|eukprot:CDW72801.1 nuclear receptor corepressor 1 [Stylonychia lemnae]
MNTKKQIQTPQKKSRAGSNATHLQSRNSASKHVQEQEKCYQTIFTLSDIRNQHLISSDVCYHKLQKEILEQIESTDKSLSEEIKASQNEMRQMIQQLMDTDALRAGESFSNLKVKSNLNINMISNPNRSASSLSINNNSSPYQTTQSKEEIKQMIMDKISKKFAPNFTNEDNIYPASYNIFQPQDPEKIVKSYLMSDELNPTLDNSYMSKVKIAPLTIQNASKVQKKVDNDFEFCVYDFQPANPNFLLLQRLDYMAKHQQQWLTNVEVQKRVTDKQLKMRYPQIFEEFRLEQKHLTGIFRSGSKNQNNQDYDDWDDIQRYRDNKADIPMSRFRFYQHEVKHEPHPQIIKNPLEYELEYKKRMIWSLRDIETFISATLENPKNFWAIGKSLPHKTSKELVFFFQAFKKLFNLKKHFNTCQVMIGLPSQAGKKQAIQDIINEVMKPIIKYQQEKRNPSNTFDINQGVAACFYGQNQIYFTVQELLQIYSGISEARRKCKEVEKDKIVDQKLSHYFFNTFAPPLYESKVDKTTLKTIDYFDKIEQNGQKLLDYYQSQAAQNKFKEGQVVSNLSRKIAMHINLYQSQKQLLPQKMIKQSLKSATQKDLLLRKRNFNEFYYQTSGRDISKWILQKQLLVEDNGYNSKRQRLSSSNFESSLINSAVGGSNSANNQSAQSKFNYEMRTYNYSSSAVFPQFITVKQQSFTEKFIEELNKEKQQMIEANKKNEEDAKKAQIDAASKSLQAQRGRIQVDIQKEFNNDKEFKTYMDKKFSSIFMENQTQNPSKQDSSSEDSNDVDDSSNNRQRKGLLQWQEDEKEKFILLLKKHGRDWCAISDELPRKTDKQCRNYFQNYKHKLNLQQYLPDKNK